MTDVSSLSEAVTALASTFTGQLLLPSDAGYDEARRGFLRSYAAVHGLGPVRQLSRRRRTRRLSRRRRTRRSRRRRVWTEHRRLQQIKAKYDPQNFFHVNQNIRPQA